MSELSLNIANPSPERAHRQLAWLASRDEHVLILTETKDSAGCRLLADAFTTAGYHVAYPIPENGDYGTMIASKVTAQTDDFGGRVSYLPSRDASAEKTERKRKWLNACHTALASQPDPPCSSAT